MGTKQFASLKDELAHYEKLERRAFINRQDAAREKHLKSIQNVYHRMRLAERAREIQRIKDNDPTRPAASEIVLIGKIEYLVGWHASGNELSPYDFFVFQESFRADKLQEWQEKLINDSPFHAIIGHGSLSSLKATWACSWYVQMNPEVVAALKARYCVV